MEIDCTFFNFYGLFLILSIFSGIIFFDIFLFKWKLNKIHILFLNIFFIFLIVLGGLGLTVFENYLLHHKLAIGFSSYGGLIGMIISVIIFSKIFKYNKKILFKLLFLTVPLIYSISKIGCFLAGCCYGIKYSGFGSVVYISSHGAPLNVNLFPVQLVESIAFGIIFIFLNILYKKNNANIISFSLISCGLSKFFLEFFRSSVSYFISFTQILSLLFVVIGIFNLKRRVKNETVDSNS